MGGFLVAVALVGVFASLSSAGRGPTTTYVVAAHDLPAGRVIDASDLDTVAIDLPAAQASTSYRNPPTLVGTILLAPVAAGELVQASVVGEAPEDGVPTVAMSLPTAAAVGGDLRPGDRVDVYVTYGDDLDAVSRLVVRAASVVAVSTPSEDAVARAGEVQVRLAIADPDQRIAVVNAVNAGTVTLVGVTGSEDGGRAGDEFRPDGP